MQTLQQKLMAIKTKYDELQAQNEAKARAKAKLGI